MSFGVCPPATVSRRNVNASPKMVSLQRDPVVHPQGCGLEVELALGVAEVHHQLLVGAVDPAELVDEVHVPGRPAELAVGRGLQADLLLHPDDVADRGVLGRAQRLVGELAGSVAGPGVEQRRRRGAGSRRGRHGTAGTPARSSGPPVGAATGPRGYADGPGARTATGPLSAVAVRGPGRSGIPVGQERIVRSSSRRRPSRRRR